MKPFFFLLVFALPLFSAKANNFYVSSSTGNDANPGTITQPWQHMKRSAAQGGNNFYFKAGDMFYNVNFPKVSTSASSRIFVGRYGTGANPVFSSFSTINSSAWSLYSPNVWVATINSPLYVTGAVPVSSNCGMIVVNGVKYGYRAGQLLGLNFQWEFFCDFSGGHIYVYSTSNPSLLSSWIMVSNDSRPITVQNYTTVDGINFEGVSTAPLFIYQPIGDTLRHCRILNCGGEQKSLTDSLRQGNGISFYNGGTNVVVENDTVQSVYDEALSMQSHATLPAPMAFTNITFRNNITDSCSADFNPTIVPAGAPGFINCRVYNNTFQHAGWSWSQNARAHDNEAISILNNYWNLNLSQVDLIIENNTIICPREGVYYLSGASTDPRFTTRNNQIFMNSNILIRKNFNGRTSPYTYTLATHTAFTTAEGYETGSTWDTCGTFISIGDTSTLYAQVYYQDADADGYGNAAVFISSTVPVSGYVLDNTDCNDTDATIHPNAPEILDGIDNDCNGIIDDCVKRRFHGQ